MRRLLTLVCGLSVMSPVLAASARITPPKPPALQFVSGPCLNMACLTFYDFRNGVLDARMTASGGANGTTTNASGQIVAATAPRFTYAPLAPYAPQGVLVEPAATNIFYPSVPGTWSMYQTTVTANATASPDGGNSGAQVTGTKAGAGSAYVATAAVPQNQQETFDVYAKAGTATQMAIAYSSNASGKGAYANFDLNAGTVLATGVYGTGTNSGATITPVGNGWYRLSVTGYMNTGSNVTTAAYPAVQFLSSATSGQYFYVWGAQLEAGSAPTSYIPTTTATVTRSADTLSFTPASGVGHFTFTYNDGTTTETTVTAGQSYTLPVVPSRNYLYGGGVY